MLLQARCDIVQNGTRGLSEVCFVEGKGYALKDDRAFGLEVIFVGLLRGRRGRRWRRSAASEPVLQANGADEINQMLFTARVVKACFDVRTQGQLARAGTILPELYEHAGANFGCEVSPGVILW